MKISLSELAKRSYDIDIKNNSYRVKDVKDGEVGEKDIKEYVDGFNRTIKPMVLKYMIEKNRYLIPEEKASCILKIYDLLKEGESTLLKISNKKYVSAKELKKAIDNLELEDEEKIEFLEIFDYEVRCEIDKLKKDIISKLENSLNYILSPNTDYKSDTRDPKQLTRQEKKKYKEEELFIEDKLEILKYMSKRYNEFDFNSLCLINDIAITRKEENPIDREEIKSLISRLSYWE